MCGATCVRISACLWRLTRPLQSPALAAALLLGGVYDRSNNATDAIFIGTVLAFIFSWRNMKATLCLPFQYFGAVFATVNFIASGLVVMSIWNHDLAAHVSSPEVVGGQHQARSLLCWRSGLGSC
jgi:hypothetical protein